MIALELILRLFILVQTSFYIHATKGLLSKKEFSKHFVKGHGSDLCLNWIYKDMCLTHLARGPFFEIDLQELHIVKNVFISSCPGNLARILMLLHITVFTKRENPIYCGTWPKKYLRGKNMTFTCSHAGPVRFLRLSRNGNRKIGMSEMDADIYKLPEGPIFLGYLFKKHEPKKAKKKSKKAKSKKTKSKKPKSEKPNSKKPNSKKAKSEVKLPVELPVRAENLAHCLLLCRANFCRAFSYKTQQDLNCLIAYTESTTADEKWDTWSMTTEPEPKV